MIASAMVSTKVRARPAVGTLGAVGLVALVLTGLHLLAIAQGPRWTSPLLIGNHLFDLMLAATILWFALALGRRVAWPLLGLSGDQLSETLAAMGLGLGLLSLGVLCLGMLHLYYGVVFLIATVALSIWLRAELLAILEGARSTVTRWFRAGMPTAPTLGQRLILLILILELAVVSVQATLPAGWSSPIEGDTLAYHLAAPKIYMQAHHIVPLPDIPLANAPAGEEILYLFGLYAGTDGLAKMLHLLFGVLLALATYALGKRLAEPAVGWLAVFLLFDVLWMGLEAPSSGPDFASFFLIVLGIADGLVWVDRVRTGRTGPGRPPTERPSRWVRWWWTKVADGDLLLVRSGILVGLGVSYKLTNIPAIPAMLAVVGLATVAIYVGAPGTLRRGTRAPITQRVPGAPTARLPGDLYQGALEAAVQAVRQMVVFGLATLIALGPWLLKNAYFFGHPLYPFGVQTSDPSQSKAITVTAATYTFGGHLAWIWENAVHILVESLSPLSILLIAGPLLLTRRSGRAALALLVFAALLWINYIPVYQYPRYDVPVMALGAVLTMSAAQTLMMRLPIRYALVELPLMAYLVLQGFFVLGLDLAKVSGDHSLEVALGRTSRDSYLAAHLRPYLAEQWVNTNTAPGTTIVMVDVTHGYYLDRPYLAEWYGTRRIALEGSVAGREGQFLSWCKAGVQYAIFDRDISELDNSLRGSPEPRASFRWVHAPGLHAQVRFSANGVDVLAITPCSAIHAGLPVHDG